MKIDILLVIAIFLVMSHKSISSFFENLLQVSSDSMTLTTYILAAGSCITYILRTTNAEKEKYPTTISLLKDIKEEIYEDIRQTKKISHGTLFRFWNISPAIGYFLTIKIIFYGFLFNITPGDDFLFYLLDIIKKSERRMRRHVKLK